MASELGLRAVCFAFGFALALAGGKLVASEGVADAHADGHAAAADAELDDEDFEEAETLKHSGMTAFKASTFKWKRNTDELTWSLRMCK